MTQYSPKSVIRFFFAQGSRRALFRWLEFRLFVANRSGDELKVRRPEQHHDGIGWLQSWAQQALTVSTILPGYLLVLAVVALFGLLSMAGALHYTQGHPINIWIPLSLFAFIPLLSTLITLVVSVRSPSANALKGHPLLNVFIKRFHLQPYLPYQELLMRWLYWQTQALALVFILAALVAFFALALFQDYRFGWSSTLIRSDTTMVQIVSVLTWPWHWWVSAPDSATISLSRFSMTGDTGSADADGWWQTLVLAIIVYGLIPRLLLMAVLRALYRRALKRNIAHASDVEQFMVAQWHEESRNAVNDDITESEMTTVSISNLTPPLIGWHIPAERFHLNKVLGVDPWHLDEQWLTATEIQQSGHLSLIVNGMATPTGELADCLDLLKNEVTLILWFEGVEPSRKTIQMKSWQYFAQQHQVNLRVGE